MYALTQGEAEEKLVKISIARGIKIPDVMRASPDVPHHLLFFWDCWITLSRDRVKNSRIRWRDVQFMAFAYRLRPSEAHALHAVVWALDGALMEYRAKAKGDG